MANHIIRYPQLHNPNWLRDQALAKTDAHIAANLGCSPTCVKRLRQAHGIPACNSPKASPLTPPHLARQPERYAPETETRRATTLIVCCPRCKWTACLPAIYDHGAWRLEPDQKIHVTKGQAIHVPCGQPLQLSAFAQAHPIQLLPPWKGHDTTR